MSLIIPPEVKAKEWELIEYLESLWIKREKIKNSDLLLTAFIHKSYAADFKEITSHNERLEFVGDGILWAVITKMLFTQFPWMEESGMTLYKIALVREETLAEAAKNIGLNARLFVSKGEEKMHGRNKETILWDAFESLLGYLYLDMGEDEVFSFVSKYLYPKIKEIREKPVKSYKTLVQEYIQREHKSTPMYVDLEKEVDDRGNVLQYQSDLMVESQVLSTWLGTNKKKAQEDAAKIFYEQVILPEKQNLQK